jgi:hypothetical protein
MPPTRRIPANAVDISIVAFGGIGKLSTGVLVPIVGAVPELNTLKYLNVVDVFETTQLPKTPPVDLTTVALVVAAETRELNSVKPPTFPTGVIPLMPAVTVPPTL